MTKKLVLLIDDNASMCKALSFFLEFEGYDVLSAANGQAALDLLQQEKQPQVIFLDLMMPVLDGWAFRKIKMQTPAIAHIPTIITSAKNNFDKTIDKLPHEYFLPKPFDLNVLAKLLQEI